MFKSRPGHIVVTLMLTAVSPCLWAGPAGVEAATDTDFHADDAHLPARVELGRLLFFDKILSGNLNIS